MKKTALLTAAATATVAIAATAGAFQYFSNLAVKRISPGMPMPARRRVDHRQQEDIFKDIVESAQKDLAELPFEELSAESDDKLLLWGRLYQAKSPKRVIIFMHGWRSSWQKDFGLNVPGLLALDSTLLLADQRCHGKSEGNYITYGVKERFDCLVWAREMAARFPGLPIYIWGVSMGAATVMLASALPLPAAVQGIIADCGYTSPEAIMTHLLKKNTLLGAGFLAAVYRQHFLRHFDFDIRGCSTVEALAKTSLPLLLFHGDGDDFVPVSMSRENYAAAHGEKELVLVGGAAHGKSFFVDSETCFKKVTAFFQCHDEPHENAK